MKPSEPQPLTPAVFHILLALADGEKHGYRIMQAVKAQLPRRIYHRPWHTVRLDQTHAGRRPDCRIGGKAGPGIGRSAPALLPVDRYRSKHAASRPGPHGCPAAARPGFTNPSRFSNPGHTMSVMASPAQRLVLPVYKRLLACYPAAFRQRFEAEMLTSFQDWLNAEPVSHVKMRASPAGLAA